MSCNGRRDNLIINAVLFTIMITGLLSYVPAASQAPTNNDEESEKPIDYWPTSDGLNGNLYDIFKERLERIQNELTYHKLNAFSKETPRLENKDNSMLVVSESKSFQTSPSDSLQYELGNGAEKHTASEREFSNWAFGNRRNKINAKLYSSSERSGRSFFKCYRKNKIESQTKKIIKNKSAAISNGRDLDLDSMKHIQNSASYTDAMSKSLYDEYCRQLNAVNYKLDKRNYRQANDFAHHSIRNWLNDNDYGNDSDYGERDFKLRNLPPQHDTEYFHSNHHRRHTENYTNPDTTGNSSSLYPSVLTKALEISLNPTVSSTSARANLLANVAQKMNTSTLDLAEKLTKSSDLKTTSVVDNHRLNKMLEHYIMNTDLANQPRNYPKFSQSMSQQVLSNISKTVPITVTQATGPNQQQLTESDEITLEVRTSNLKELLDRVLNKLEKLHDAQNRDDESRPDGTPCDILGSWSSITLGLCFDIQLTKDRVGELSPAEVNNRMLSVEVQECTPPRHHSAVDLEWKFGGSALKQIGGPFYMYSQKRSENLVGTFLGFCRTCGGIDTIFGSWTFLTPSRDCVDISLAFDVKRDMLLRDRMEMKRKERFKDLLYQGRIGKSKNLRHS